MPRKAAKSQRHSRSVKKRFKKRFLKHSISKALLLLDAGNYPSQIARLLHVSPQCLHYHIKKWLRIGWIKLDKKTPNATFYKVSKRIKKSLTGGKDFGYKGVRLHAYSLKFPILREPRVSVDWRSVAMAGGHWNRLIGSEAGLTVEKTTKHVIIHADEVVHPDPNEATLLAIFECLRLARTLEAKFDMELGQPTLLRKPHWGIYFPIAGEIAKLMEFSDDIGKIDLSEGFAEIDLYNPNLAKELLLTPVYLRALLQLQAGFAQGMADHRAMIKEIRGMARETRDLVEELRHQNKRGDS